MKKYDQPPYDHQKTAILEIAISMKSPVFNAADLTKRLYGHGRTSNSPQYRWTLNTLHKMNSEGLVGHVHWPGANNVTVWWLTSRLQSEGGQS